VNNFSDLFMVCLSLSLAATVISGLIYFVQKVANKRLTQTWKYYIWLIVLFRLVIPVAPEGSLIGTLFSPLQEQNLASDSSVPILNETKQVQETTNSPEVNMNKNTSVNSTVPTDSEDKHTSASAITTPTPATLDSASSVGSITSASSTSSVTSPASSTTVVSTFSSILWMTLSIMWLIGAGLLFGWKIIGYLRFKRQLNIHQVTVKDELVVSTLAIAKQKKGIHVDVPVFQNALITSPMLVGLQTPCIVLPQREFTEQQLHYIFSHELTHLKRGDLWLKWMAQLALCLHWFNPIIYKLVKQFNQACELSCDEAVIKGMNVQQKQGYGETLIALAASKQASGAFVGTMSTEKSNLKDRLTAIMQSEKSRKPRLISMLAISLVLIVSAIFVGSATPSIKASQVDYDFSRLKINDISLGQDEQDIHTELYTPAPNNTSLKYQHQFEELNYQTNSEGRIVAFMNKVYGKGAYIPYVKVEQKERFSPFLLKSLTDLEGLLGKEKSTWYDREQKLKSVTYQDTINQIRLRAIYSDQNLELVWLQVEYTTEQPKKLYSPYNLEVLSQAKTPYIGDASKVSKIAGSLNTPYPTYIQNFISLQTTKEPYGVTVFYEPRSNAELSTLPPFSDVRFERQLRKNALVLLSMIDNAGEVTFAFRSDPSPERILVENEYSEKITFERQKLEAEFGSLKELGNDLDKLDRLLLNWK
jgi:beta-lactamase regulating signal transducer with metallopeptidase domain